MALVKSKTSSSNTRFTYGTDLNRRTYGGLTSVSALGSGTVNLNTRIPEMFINTKDYKDLTTYRLMRGVPDFGSLVQFNPYESGYAAFIICGMPKFIEVLAKKNSSYNKLMQNWAHIIEFEFKNFDGLQDMDAETIQLGDDLNSINVISRVNSQGASEFTLTYDEKSGSPLRKFAQLYLTGIKDPKTQVKTYHGLIHNGDMEPGFENEVFTFLFMNTDNTMRFIEHAVLLIGCQLNSVDLSMYNYTKNDINKHETQVKFSGYPITSNKVEGCAQDMLSFLLSTESGARQIIVNSVDYDYTGTERIAKTMENQGADMKKYAYASEVSGKVARYNTDKDFKYKSTNNMAGIFNE